MNKSWQLSAFLMCPLFYHAVNNCYIPPTLLQQTLNSSVAVTVIYNFYFVTTLMFCNRYYKVAVFHH